MWDLSSFSRILELENIFITFESPLQGTDLSIETENCYFQYSTTKKKPYLYVKTECTRLFPLPPPH